MPVDVIDLPVGKQRYGLLTTEEGTIIDDLMFFNKGRGRSSSSSTAPARSVTSPTSRPRSARAARSFPCPTMALLALPRPAGRHRPGAPGTRRGKAGVHDRRQLHRGSPAAPRRSTCS